MSSEKVCKTSHTNYFLYYLLLSSCESCIPSALLQQLMIRSTLFILVYQLDWSAKSYVTDSYQYLKTFIRRKVTKSQTHTLFFAWCLMIKLIV